MTEDEIKTVLQSDPALATRVVGQLSFASPWYVDSIEGDDYHIRIVVAGLARYQATVNPPDGERCSHCGELVYGNAWTYDIGWPDGGAPQRSERGFDTYEEAKSAVDAILRDRGVALS